MVARVHGRARAGRGPRLAALDAALRARLAGIVGERHVLADPELTAGYERDVTGRFGGRAAGGRAAGGRRRGGGGAGRLRRRRAPPWCRRAATPGWSAARSRAAARSCCRSPGSTAIGPLDAAAGADHGRRGRDARRRWPRRCAARGLALGVDFAARDSATIGGMAATDAGGAQVLRHGTMRARVAGLEAVLADGRVLRRLSGLVKDNAGYDLPALLVGSEGTLAVITAVRLALVAGARARRHGAARRWTRSPTPSRSSPACAARLPSLQAADFFLADGLELVCAHRRSPPPLPRRTPSTCSSSAATTTDPTEALAAALEDEAAVRDVAVADDTARRAALWTYREAHNEALNAAGVPHKLDVSVPLAAIAAFADGDRRRPSAPRGARLILYGHLGDGNLHVNVLGPAPDDEAVDEDGAAARRRARRLDQRRARRRRREARLARPDAHAGGDRRDGGRSRRALDPAGRD